MPRIPAPPVSRSQVGRAVHDLGLAGLLGGNLFGRLGLHPSVTTISDQLERGKVVNAAWRRYGTINTFSLIAVSTGWVGARLNEAADRRLSPEERRLARAKDVLVAASLVAEVALVSVNAALNQRSFRRPAARRLLPRVGRV